MKQLKFTLGFMLLLISTALIYSGCNRFDSNPETIRSATNPTQQKVSSSVVGKVVDENGKGVENAVARLGSLTTQTDKDGYFFFENVQMSAPYSYVQVERNGYFKGSRTFPVKSGHTQFVNIEMLRRTIRGSFSSANGGTVQFDGVSVTIPANGVMLANGQPYSGLVKIAGQYLSPDAENLGQIMPGALMAYNQGNEFGILKTYGMAGIELEGQNGEALQVRTGSEATLEISVANSQLNDPLTQIPLWYFDENTGFWKEEGVAVRNGNKFTGTVKHFTFWNVDWFTNNLVNIDILITDPAGNPIANKSATVSSNGAGTSFGTTDNLGILSGLVPSGQVLNINVMAGCAMSPTTPGQIGPFFANGSAGPLHINSTNTNTVNLSGSVTDCSGQPLSNGFVKIQMPSFVDLVAVNNGNYFYSYTGCNNISNVQLSLTPFSSVTHTEGISTPLAVNPGTNYSGVNLNACQAGSEFVLLGTNGNRYNFVESINLETYNNVNNLFLTATNSQLLTPLGSLSILVTKNPNGTYSCSTLLLNYGNTFYDFTTVSSIEVTHWPQFSGDYLDCNLTGTYGASPTTMSPFSLNVHAKKD
ncbi:MAG: carboxypeptidase-like regulatory domain-containing protein [Bacteroidia bacterium]|nr:carboxypeptidase-like regulatory domain-containing protein [Bacteroidia bacterium]